MVEGREGGGGEEGERGGVREEGESRGEGGGGGGGEKGEEEMTGGGEEEEVKEIGMEHTMNTKLNPTSSRGNRTPGSRCNSAVASQ